MDDTTRQLLIQDLTKQRNLFQMLALLSSVVALVSLGVCAFGKPNLSGVGVLALMFFYATIQWILTFKYESEIRLLKLVDKLKK